ncbi:helicase-related protein [Streptomyces sp. NPDC056817]|uniref:helicase-related protein n=1 Tax=Streptomyces sp. NPDC056817 TaxID=3345950 RepID=UPI0036CC8FDC
MSSRRSRRASAQRRSRRPAATVGLCGEHVPERRREVLAGFSSTAQRAVLSNCRVLGEGVDIRAVDSVALLDPKGAPHDIVQAIGRALRQKPGQGKLASLIVPVFLQPGEKPEDMFTSGSYRPLVKVLEGLRAHDEEAVELLAIPQEMGAAPTWPFYQPVVGVLALPGDGPVRPSSPTGRTEGRSCRVLHGYPASSFISWENLAPQRRISLHPLTDTICKSLTRCSPGRRFTEQAHVHA